MDLYYIFSYHNLETVLKLFSKDNDLYKLRFIIPCKQGNNLLITVDNYFQDNNIDFKYTQLIPL